MSRYTLKVAHSQFLVRAIDLGATVLSRQCILRFLNSSPGGLFRVSRFEPIPFA